MLHESRALYKREPVLGFVVLVGGKGYSSLYCVQAYAFVVAVL